MIKRQVLGNGLRILYEPMEGVRSAALGIFVEASPRLEKDEPWGISHFVEHMVFKGTKSRSAGDIAKEMDTLGGHANAYTTREHTCYHTRTLGEDALHGFDILSDMLKNSLFDKKDIETERRVVSEEIDMYEDSPEDIAIDSLSEHVWQGSTLAIPILGTKETLARIDEEAIRSYMARGYAPSRIAVAAAGCFDERAMTEAIEAAFGGTAAPHEPDVEEQIPYTPGLIVNEKEQEQNHICIAMPAPPLGHRDSYAYTVLTGVLGGSMSSRLFQRIREELGLCYSIYSFTTAHRGAGMLCAYAALSQKAQHEVIREVAMELSRLRSGVSKEEFTRAKDQLRANIIMSNESPSSRMGALGRGELIYRRAIGADETLSKIEAVTQDDVNRLCEGLARPDTLAMSITGQVGEGDDSLFNELKERL